jgi:hypothetical protein
MKIELIVGRNKNREIFEVSENEDPGKIATALVRLSRPYLMSAQIEATWSPERKIGLVIIGGFRTVGNAKVIS